MPLNLRSALTRSCAYAPCPSSFQTSDLRRLYCCDSCKTQAFRAARRAQAAAKQAKVAKASLAAPAASSALPASGPSEARAELAPSPVRPLSWGQTVTATAVGTVLGKLIERFGERVAAAFKQARVQPQLGAETAADPLSWLPASLLTLPAPRCWQASPLWATPQKCVQLAYFGHVLYWQPTHRCLLWEIEPGQLWLLTSAHELALLAELDLPPAALAPLELEAPSAWAPFQYRGGIPRDVG